MMKLLQVSLGLTLVLLLMAFKPNPRPTNYVAPQSTMVVDTLFENSFALFQQLRHSTGVYSDALRFQGAQFHPASVATTGMGLISLCIADSMGWINDAEAQVIHTLKSMAGQHPTFQPEQNQKGLFRHFIDQNTGAQAWNSEFSSIDTGILIAGALFCKQYFAGNTVIAELADDMYLSVDWASTIANPVTGGIYLTQNMQGIGAGITKPFNEYMIVAWLAKNDMRNDSVATLLWDNHYADPANLPTSTFAGIDVLTDSPGNFLSGFVHQFPYYLCNYYTTHPDYLMHLDRARRIDSTWWRDNTFTSVHVWGFGAGASNVWSPSGYHADNISDHPGNICSPHIIAGFIPIFPDAILDLEELVNQNLGLYNLPFGVQETVLWRFSTLSNWKADDIQGIDFSTMLLGLAAHPDYLGTAFFETYNDFSFPEVSTSIELEPSIELKNIFNYPNPFSQSTRIQFEIEVLSDVELTISNSQGQQLEKRFEKNVIPGEYEFVWDGEGVSSGVYFYTVCTKTQSFSGKMVLKK
ncbi:MAG: T9SS type A sorting domain-containing protein [Bacteroidia bacterium]